MFTRLSPGLKGILFALLGFLVFSTHDAIVKSLANYSVFQIIFFAMLFGYVPFSMTQVVDATPKTLKPNNPAMVIFRSLLAVGSLVFAFIAFTVLPLVQAYVLLFLTPVIISLLSIVYLDEKIHKFRWFAIIMGLVGVVIVLRPSLDNLHWGQLAGITSALCSGGVGIISRKIGNKENAATLLIYPLLANIIVTGSALYFVYKPMPLGDLVLMFSVGFLALLGQRLNIQAYRMSNATVIAPLQYSQLIWAIIFGSLFFSESVDFWTYVGSSVVILSGIMIIWREAKVSTNKPNITTRNTRMVASSMATSSHHDDKWVFKKI